MERFFLNDGRYIRITLIYMHDLELRPYFVTQIHPNGGWSNRVYPATLARS